VEVVVAPPPVLPPPLPLSPPPLHPDFTLEKFYYYNSSLVEKDPISFAVLVKNTGTERSATSTVYFAFDKDNNKESTNPLAERTVNPLIPEETTAVTWKNALVPTPGTHKVTVCLHVLEGAYSDRCESFLLTVTPQPSDLIVKSISVEPENLVAGDTVTVKVVIKNQAKGNASHALTSLRIDAQNNSSWDFVANELPLSNLGGGETTTLEWTAVWRTVKGFNRLEVCTDVKEELAETDEQNNCKISIFSVQPGIYTGSESVTFFIEDGAVSPASQSVVPGGVVIFANLDPEGYFISGDLDSFYVELETEKSTQAPLYTGVYKFYHELSGIRKFEGTVVVE